MKLINYIQTVEVPTNSTTKTKFYFQEQPLLRKKRILYMNAWFLTYISKSPSGLALISSAVFYKSFLVLVSKNKEVINRIPLNHLIIGYSGNRGPLLIDHIIDFPKSYIEVGSIANLDANATFLFTFYCNDIIKELPEYRNMNIENIEVKTTPATLHKFFFPDNENLRNKRIQFIEYAHDNISMTPGGYDVVNDTVKEKSFLTIVSKGQEIIRKIPVNFLLPLYEVHKIPLDSVEIDFPDSYVEIPDTTNTVADQRYFFNIYFYDRVITKKN